MSPFAAEIALELATFQNAAQPIYPTRTRIDEKQKAVRKTAFHYGAAIGT
jgi:hypothetical protein